MIEKLTASEAAAASTGARFALLQVRPESQIHAAALCGFREGIEKLQLPSDAVVQLQISYKKEGNGGMSATADLLTKTEPGVQFMGVADSNHPLMVFMLGLTEAQAAAVRAILCSSPVIIDPNIS